MCFLGKSKSGFPNPKTDFAFFWANPKTDYESVKSTLCVDSSDQIKIRTLEIHDLSVYFGKGFEKSIFDELFSEQKWYTTDTYMYKS